jgi:hypothetical protein
MALEVAYHINHDHFADLTARKMFLSPKTSGAKFSTRAYVVKIDRFQSKIAVNNDLTVANEGIFWGCFLGKESFCPAQFNCSREPKFKCGAQLQVKN